MMLQNLLLIMISNIFLIFKSILFWINLVISVLIFGPVTFLIGLISYNACLNLSKAWCRYNLFFLKTICSLSFIYNGPDLNSSQLVVSRHQSAWETIFLAAYVSKPIFILKKELLWVPIFGWCLYLLKNVPIDRSDGIKSLKKIIKSYKDHIEKKRTLIIFPEGTRVPYGEKSEIKKGVLKILDFLKIHFLVMNHDAGKYWNKSSFIIRPGVIDINTQSVDFTDDMYYLKKKITHYFY